jgi:hypothetical protein
LISPIEGPHYVRNVLGCAFLAPDIIEAILDGRQPERLKFEHLYKHIPIVVVVRQQPPPFLALALNKSFAGLALSIE